MRVFRLFAFSDSRIIVITRGENEEQAMTYATRENGAFSKGVTVFPLDYLPIDAAHLYSKNHADGWLYRAPMWLQKQERNEAIEKGLDVIMNELKEQLKKRTQNVCCH